MLHVNASCVMFLNVIFFASCIRRNDDSIRFRAAFDSRPPIHLSSSRIAFFFSFFIYLFSSFPFFFLFILRFLSLFFSCSFRRLFLSLFLFLFSFFIATRTVWSELNSVWVELGRVELNCCRFRIVVLFDSIRFDSMCCVVSNHHAYSALFSNHFSLFLISFVSGIFLLLVFFLFWCLVSVYMAVWFAGWEDWSVLSLIIFFSYAYAYSFSYLWFYPYPYFCDFVL